MSDTRYGHSGAGGGRQDQGERKDEGWTSRQGGDQTREGGSRRDPDPSNGPGHDRGSTTERPAGTNTQGELAGIREAADDVASEHGQSDGTPGDAETGVGFRERDARGAGTDQPPRMGGPLGPNPDTEPHLPEGAQTSDERGSGAGGFDVGVNAKVVGAVHQGVKEEEA